MRRQLFLIHLSYYPAQVSQVFPRTHALKAQKFCKVKPIHRNHVFGMTVFYQFQITGNGKGLYATMKRWRI